MFQLLTSHVRTRTQEDFPPIKFVTENNPDYLALKSGLIFLLKQIHSVFRLSAGLTLASLEVCKTPDL